MFWRLALLVLFGMFLAWYEPSPGRIAAPLPVREEAPAVLSEHQVRERTEQCDKTSRDAFRREWQEGAANTEDGVMTADFRSHYNAKLDACFLLLTVNQTTNDNSQGNSTAGTLRQMLFDINQRELYGEYAGAVTGALTAIGLPAKCRVEGLFCASKGEWDVLVAQYMDE